MRPLTRRIDELYLPACLSEVSALLCVPFACRRACDEEVRVPRMLPFNALVLLSHYPVITKVFLLLVCEIAPLAAQP